MEFSKVKSPPFHTEMIFGDGPDEVLPIVLDRDIVTESFLIEMDARARSVFRNQLAGVRRILETRGLLPTPEPTEAPKTKRQSAKAKAEDEIAERVKQVTAKALDELQKMIPAEEESVLLAQAAQLTYMHETLARVILDWELTVKNVKMPITEKRDLDCCKQPESDCRHASSFIRGWSLPVTEKFFQFCCFEAHEPKKKAETQSAGS
jgi:hypothetical protein